MTAHGLLVVCEMCFYILARVSILLMGYLHVHAEHPAVMEENNAYQLSIIRILYIPADRSDIVFSNLKKNTQNTHIIGLTILFKMKIFQNDKLQIMIPLNWP